MPRSSRKVALSLHERGEECGQASQGLVRCPGRCMNCRLQQRLWRVGCRLIETEEMYAGFGAGLMFSSQRADLDRVASTGTQSRSILGVGIYELVHLGWSTPALVSAWVRGCVEMYGGALSQLDFAECDTGLLCW